MFALVQAACLVDADTPLQTGHIHRLLESRLQLRFSIGVTTGARAAGFASIGADKYVPLILCQEVPLRKISVVIFIIKGSRSCLVLSAVYSGPKTGLGWKRWIPTT
jgi:hypothetical protein